MGLFVVERELVPESQVRAVWAIERDALAQDPERGARLLRSYGSRDQRHMVSLYDAEGIEDVWQLQRAAGLPAAHVWAAIPVVDRRVEPPPGYVTVVAQRAAPEGVTLEQVRHASSDPKGCNQRMRLIHFGTYLASEAARMCCMYYSPDLESVRIANRESGSSYEHLWSGQELSAPSSSMS